MALVSRGVNKSNKYIPMALSQLPMRAVLAALTPLLLQSAYWSSYTPRSCRRSHRGSNVTTPHVHTVLPRPGTSAMTGGSALSARTDFN